MARCAPTSGQPDACRVRASRTRSKCVTRLQIKWISPVYAQHTVTLSCSLQLEIIGRYRWLRSRLDQFWLLKNHFFLSLVSKIWILNKNLRGCLDPQFLRILLYLLLYGSQKLGISSFLVSKNPTKTDSKNWSVWIPPNFQKPDS